MSITFTIEQAAALQKATNLAVVGDPVALKVVQTFDNCSIIYRSYQNGDAALSAVRKNHRVLVGVLNLFILHIKTL